VCHVKHIGAFKPFYEQRPFAQAEAESRLVAGVKPASHSVPVRSSAEACERNNSHSVLYVALCFIDNEWHCISLTV